MNLLKIAKAPAVVSSAATVMDAIRVMEGATVGAVVIVDDDVLKGIFTERDLMLRVVLEEKEPKTTPIIDVMTSKVMTIRKDTAPDDVLKTMWERHIRHLPIIDDDGKVEAMVSIRHLLDRKVEHLTRELDSLEAYLTADGIGG